MAGKPQFNTWESYFYPAPFNYAMRNKLDIRDSTKLRLIEYTTTMRRACELGLGKASIPQTFDAEHVKLIHQYLFQDFYDWAGEYRSVNMYKGAGKAFADVLDGEVDRYLIDMHTIIKDTDWKSLNKEEFAVQIAKVFASLNYAHPFREGNGRTSKILIHHVCEQSQFKLVFGEVSPYAWNMSSMLSSPEDGKFEPQHEYLIPVFYAAAIERDAK